MIVEDVAIVFGVATVVALGELLLRYQDRRNVFWSCRWFWAYIGFNGLFAALVLLVMRLSGPSLSSHGPQTLRVTQAVAAGGGGLALLRASSFLSRAGDDSSQAGASLVRSTGAILSYAIRQADRQVRDAFGAFLTRQAQPHCVGWSYDDQGAEVAATCVALAELPDEEQAAFLRRLSEIRGMKDMGPNGKRLLLARACVQYTSAATLKSAVAEVTAALRTPAPPARTTPIATDGQRDRARRPRKPRVRQGLGCDGYPDDVLLAMTRWALWGRTTDDEALDLVVRELGFQRRGPKITGRVRAALDKVNLERQ